MGARNEVQVVDKPWPVVFDAFVKALPMHGFRLTGIDPERGRIRMETRNTRFTLAVGAIDAITTEWVATAELKLGLFRERHVQHFASIGEALDAYLRAYYAEAGADYA